MDAVAGAAAEARVRCASECRRCPGVVAGSAVEGAGPSPATVMFVGEAPGRLGAGRTGVPFLGDVAGMRFERLLAESGLAREEVFVTNAVQCLPLDGHGRNRRPKVSEVRECSGWLAEQMARVGPAVVVALGGVALTALGRIEAHGLSLAGDVGVPQQWHGRMLVALYHPGARAGVHRGWELQLEDWRQLGDAVRAAGG